MNNNYSLQVFAFKNKEVHTLERDGEPWFVAKDVCDILDIGNPTETLRNFPEGEHFALSSTEGKILGFDHVPAGINLVNEPGMYRLVFQSRKPEAEAFKTWVFHEVLPALRKTGKYEIPKEFIQRTQEKIDEMVKNTFIPPEIGGTASLSRFMGKWIEKNLACVLKITGRDDLSLLRHQLSELSWAYDGIRNRLKNESSAEILNNAQQEFEKERENLKISLYYI